MPDKLEVLPGPGLVARFGDVAVWAGPQASPALQSHLVSEAQRLAQSPGSGDQLTNSFISVLQRGDPEPNSPFAVLGPGANGLTLFLHGPVQAWDSGRWLAPQPVPGWLVTSIGRPWPLIVLPYGASPPPQSQPGNPLDLLAGAVAGAGFVLLRPNAAGGPPTGGQPASQPVSAGSQSPAPGSPGGRFAPGPAGAPAGAPLGGAPTLVPGGPVAGGPVAGGPVPSGPFSGGPVPGGPGGGTAVAGGTSAGVSNVGGSGSQTSAPERPNLGQSGPAAAPIGPLADLRSGASGPASPLPGAAEWAGPAYPGSPDVPGNRCDRGHFNHPRATSCGRCGHSLVPQVTATSKRLPVGILLADDGSVWCLDQGCVIGEAAASAPEVLSGQAQPIVMKAGPNHNMAPVHAEIQLREWSVHLVDRGADGGTCVQPPTSSQWSVLGRNEQRELVNGSHISCGGRVLTFLSAWPA